MAAPKSRPELMGLSTGGPKKMVFWIFSFDGSDLTSRWGKETLGSINRVYPPDELGSHEVTDILSAGE